MPFPATNSKLTTLDAALPWRRSFPGRLVFTNGVFDLLHRGHVEYLEAARALGDGLVVAINSDSSARLLTKGSDRPLVPAADRARLLAALACVDRVIVFDEPTPLSVIEALAPDVLAKGGDYTRASVVGADFVESRGGQTVLIPLVPRYSTTSLVERIRASR